MRYPWANTVLLVLLAVQLVSGTGSLLSGSERLAWVIGLHGLGAYAVAAALLWKGAVIVRALRRRSRWTLSRIAFIVLTVLLLATLITGFLWSHSGPDYVGGFSLITIHGFLAVTMVLLMLWHLLAKRFILRVPKARDRRAFLRLGGISLTGLLLWRMDRPAQAALKLPGAVRRFTGSYETGSFTGQFPHVSWLFDNPAAVEVQPWRLRLNGAVDRSLTLSFADLERLPQATATAVIDCTGGWYSTQEWSGVPLVHLLELAGVQRQARSVTVESITGYYRRFSLTELEGYLLATHVAGNLLDHGHGFPLRLVAPDKRGFEWVKWVMRVQVNKTGKHWQPPLPLQ